jgi:transcriptional regulator with XRE-family HTH domain
LEDVTVVEGRDHLKARVGRRLVEAMDDEGWSIQRLASTLGVDRRDVRRWRNGQVEPVYRIREIAFHLNRDVGWFYEDRVGEDDDEQTEDAA